MQTFLVIILLFLAITFWHATLVVIGALILVSILKKIYKNRKKNARDKKMAEIAAPMRKSLRRDRVLLVSVIASTIRKHWDVLEDKFEQHVDEDDYGNMFMMDGFKREFVYFSEKVVLPELQRHIDNHETTNKDMVLILLDTLQITQHVTKEYFGIKPEDTDHDIASKLLAAVGENSDLGDELLYTLYTQPLAKDKYVSEATPIFMQNPSITLSLHEKLQISKPIMVTPFVCLVFILFSAMHNNKKNDHVRKKHKSEKIFTGNDPYKYEEFVKDLLRSEGYSAKRTRGSGDYGVDVIASKKGKTYAIQCKLYNRTVGVKAVQEIVSGRVYYKTDYAVVVSDNSFTNAAKSMARKSGVILTHHKNLIHKIESLDASENETHNHNEPVAKQASKGDQEPVKKQWTQDDDDELITVILPTIRND